MDNLLKQIELKNRSFKGSSKLAMQDYEIERDYYKGKGPHINTIKGPLHPGKIHTFKYDPKTKDRLAYYDKSPLVIAIGSVKGADGRMDLGINLNFIPAKQKYFVMDLIWRSYYGKYNDAMGKGDVKPIDQKLVHLNYEHLKKLLIDLGLGFAIRTYYPNRMSSAYVCCYEYWPLMALLDIKDMEGINETEIKKFYTEYINKA